MHSIRIFCLTDINRVMDLNFAEYFMLNFVNRTQVYEIPTNFSETAVGLFDDVTKMFPCFSVVFFVVPSNNDSPGIHLKLLSLFSYVDIFNIQII